MWTLADFYKTKEWQRLVDIIRLERTNDQGEIICAHCGKPILRKYDCIAHHFKTYLTDENVNDAAISLNPDNIQLVHHACHNRIHNKLGYIRKEIYLIYGPPLAGKSSYIKDVAQEGDLVVSMDNIWACITGADRYSKPQRLNAVAFGVRDFLLDVVKTRRGKWNNAYICGGFPLVSERERVGRETGARMIFIDTPREECLQRAADLEDQDTRVAYCGYIDDWFRKHGRDTEL